jgi:hypothetical protein
MAVEYLVLQAEAQDGPFARVTAHKLNQSWETLQAALDELGQYGWDLCTTIYSATREHGGCPYQKLFRRSRQEATCRKAPHTCPVVLQGTCCRLK